MEIIFEDRLNGGKDVLDNSSPSSLSFTCIIALNFPTQFYRWGNRGSLYSLKLGIWEGHAAWAVGEMACRGVPRGLGEVLLLQFGKAGDNHLPEGNPWQRSGHNSARSPGGQPHSDSASPSFFPIVSAEHMSSGGHPTTAADILWAGHHREWRSMWHVAPGLNESHCDLPTRPIGR